MKKFWLMVGILSLVAASALAAVKSYQVTGVVKSMTADMIVVEKPNKELWDIARDGGSKVTGDLKVGSKVTVEYRMTATSVTVKAEKAAAPAKKKK